MATELDKLKMVLAELFQLDAAEDLDFGMYRMLRLRREALQTFLGTTLEAEVRAAMGSLAGTERGAVEARMRAIEAQAARYGGRADADPEYVELVKRMKGAGDAAQRERQVCAHLAAFFARYYEDGDFLSLPRLRRAASGRDTYAIPYDGSEVVLHWANKDQYYVKSGEYFARYAFALEGGRRVVFRLVDAQTDPDNVKSAESGKRRFRLVEGADAVREEDGALVCQFVYAADEVKQPLVNATTEERVRACVPAAWLPALFAESARGSDPKPSVFGWHLRQYTERNKRDYFIHTNLGGFLRGELDHYLKTEVFDLDAVEAMDPADVTRAVELVRTVRKVARPIVTFLATMEDFQKRLFLKKKMVLRTEWCVTLDRVDERFYARIASNAAQVQRWQALYAIHELGEAVTEEFLKQNTGLVVETRWFDAAFTAELLASLPGPLDAGVTGVLVRGENLQALEALAAANAGAVSHVFIDPPYNTGSDGFPYKDGYQHSSWLSLLEGRIRALRKLVTRSSVVCVATDYVENARLRMLLDRVLGEAAFLADVAWEKRYTRSNNAKKFYSLKDTVTIYAAGGAVNKVKEGRTEKSKGNYSNPDGDARGPWISSSYVNPAMKEARQNLAYPITNPFTGAVVEHPTHAWKYEPKTHAEHVLDKRLYWGLTGEYEFPRLKGFLSEASDVMVPVDVWTHKYAGSTDDGGRTLKDLFGASVFDNPKPTELVERCLELRIDDQPCTKVLDFFAGSGTTGHAVLNLNRTDEGKRSFILVEVNDYFDTVLVPRILKATYSKEWKDGKPVDRTPVPGGALYKVLYLESYEDTLANIELPPPPDENPLPFTGGLRREYVIRYLLDRESRGAELDLDRFRKPFGWTMEVRRGGLVEPAHPVDLVETFTCLLGLQVSRVGSFGAPDQLRYVEGTVRAGGDVRRVLVLWRDCDAVPDAELLRLLDDPACAPLSTRAYDTLYVNGDPPLAKARRPGELWKVLAIEDAFKRLAFAGDADA